MTIVSNFSVMLDQNTIRDLTQDVIGPDGHVRIMPASFYASTTKQERVLLGHRHAVYSLPTDELIHYLREFIGDRSAIEIGAVNGVVAASLGIPATDSRMQEDPNIVDIYKSMGQPVIRYGDNVEKLDAQQAVDKYRPQVVIAQWVTHKYREDRHAAGGNMFGVVEEKIIDGIDDYAFIGNEITHVGKSIWSLPHTKISPDWLYSRAASEGQNFIGVWKGKRTAVK